jgi:rare lipoprotein A
MTFSRPALGAAMIALACVAAPEETNAQPTGSGVQTVTGAASWYGSKFHGRRTANGERFDMNGMTAAHRTLPFGTKVRVTNQRNGRSVTVRINDRGPFSGNRVIDLSRGAAESVGMVRSGVAPVRLEVLGR